MKECSYTMVEVQNDFQKLNKAAVILKTVAHPTRLAIINLLDAKKEMTVNQLADQLLCEQSLLSHHLIHMKNRGLLTSRKEGLRVYYSIKEQDIIGLISCIENCNCNL